MAGDNRRSTSASICRAVRFVIRHLITNPSYSAKVTLSKLLGVRVGSGCRIHPTVNFTGPERISLGHNVYIGRHCHLKCLIDSPAAPNANLYIADGTFIGEGTIIDANYEVSIGTDTLIGPNCMVIDSNHVCSNFDRPVSDQGQEYGSVRIGNGCWLGAHVVILPGVTVGDYTVVGANSTVTHSIPSHSVAVGSPARVTRKR